LRKVDFWIRDALVERIPVASVVVGEAELDEQQLVKLLASSDCGDIDLDCPPHVTA